MKINGMQPLPVTPSSEQGKSTGKTSGAGNANQTAETPAAVTHFSPALENTSQDIDMARVNELKEAIRDGRLDIRADQIADSLIDSVRELLDN
ncbi:flagellar biosynthesis anti-sigma factor FlgM [Idiomarina sp. A28L]|uniref:flagellar biosynthesis anti-sigma factor FlgM n=1 Tax=Idiomarina sp. A28L TaxID=1036674 RepID=UPI0002ECF22A|nr:flagellar biosynthesis anti-sigma factor FlgM [Idiomarina sp. A28L]